MKNIDPSSNYPQIESIYHELAPREIRSARLNRYDGGVVKSFYDLWLHRLMALAHGYLGATVRNARYYGWFHWPAYQPADTDPLCQYSD
jgi:hypothetical protein